MASTNEILLALASGSVGGAIAGAIISNWLAESRESYAREYASALSKDARKRNFLGFMRGWRVDTVRSAPQIISDRFPEKVELFEREIAQILGDYDDPTIERMTQAISSSNLGRIRQTTHGQEEPGKEELLGKMNALIDYVSAN